MENLPAAEEPEREPSAGNLGSVDLKLRIFMKN
jgi:hypothetical protein